MQIRCSNSTVQLFALERIQQQEPPTSMILTKLRVRLRKKKARLYQL